MKPPSPLPSLLLSSFFLSPLPSLALPPISPYGDAQAAFSQNPLLGVTEDKFHSMAMGWMDDAKKAILKGKENLERWYHEEKEYIKQDNLLCENHLFTKVLSADMS
jgi:cathepsin A (carboxypeptidase C)